MVKVYGIKNCNSVRKALKFFKEYNIEFHFVDLKKEKPTLEIIEYWIDKTCIDKLFNNKSTTYKNLKLKDLNLHNNEKKQWLHKEPMLIKRPIVEYKNKVLVGFSDDEYKSIFLKNVY